MIKQLIYKIAIKSEMILVIISKQSKSWSTFSMKYKYLKLIITIQI